MPVSGRPTNFALLKMTHGSSGADTNGFQKVANSDGAFSLVESIATAAFLPVESSQPIVARAISSSADRQTTAMGQRREARTLPSSTTGSRAVCRWILAGSAVLVWNDSK